MVKAKYNKRVINICFHLNGSILANYYLGVHRSLTASDFLLKLDLPFLALSMEDYGDVEVDNDRFLDGICNNRLEIRAMLKELLFDVLRKNSEALCIKQGG
jgi:hypothetical protein